MKIKTLKAILCLAILSPVAALAAPLRVLIDPGHGGRDVGTSTHHHKESAITLNVAQELYKKLAKDARFHPELTRRKDQAMTLMARSFRAKEFNADVFLSIHVNSSPDKRARGAEFYFQNQLPPDEESMFLAHRENATVAPGPAQTYAFIDQNQYSPEVRSIVTDLLDGDRITKSAELSRALKQAWRGQQKTDPNVIRQAPFHVLSQITSPSVLVELGYLTNAQDFAILTSPKDQTQIAENLYRALQAYLAQTN